MKIEISINKYYENSDIEIAEAVAHEISVHAMPYLSMIRDLRSGKLSGSAFVQAWKNSTKEGGINNCKQQHTKFSNKKNEKFNKIIKELLSKISDPEKRKELEDKVNEDIENCKQNLENEE